MRHKFDKGNFIEDLISTVNDAKKNTPSLVVVPTEREVRTFERIFADDDTCNHVFCCTFADYYDANWLMIKPRPVHHYIFRVDDIMNNLSANAVVEYSTSVSKRRPMKKEEEK